MENTSEPSTERETERQKLARHMAAVFEEIDTYREALSKAESSEDLRRVDELRERLDPLSITKRIEYHILLAWGGPSYGFKLYYDPETREFVNGLFYFANWFTYEEQWLSAEELDRVIEAHGLYSYL